MSLRLSRSESRAGYDILVAQVHPKVGWLTKHAKRSAAEEYDALHQPEIAARFKAEFAALNAKPVDASAKK